MSVLLALLANVHRNSKQSAFTPADFNPYESVDLAKAPPPQVDLSVLKMFVERGA